MARYRTKKQAVYEFLKQHILDGTLEPGMQIENREVAKELDVSDSPVREAIHQLRQEGLITVKPYVGTVVSALSKTDLKHIYDVRTLLESNAAKQAVPFMKENDFKHLEAIIKKIEKSMEDPMLCAELNKEFHMEIYKKSGNPYLIELIEVLWTNIYRYNHLIYSKEHVKRNMNDHWIIIDALRKRDLQKLEEVIVGHQLRSKEKFLQIIDERGASEKE